MLYGTKERLTTYIDPELVRQLDDYCRLVGLSRSDVSRLAMMDYLKKIEKQETREPVASDQT